MFDLDHLPALLARPWVLVMLAFQVWMLVDAFRREEWMWVVFIFLFPFLNAILYFILVYRNASAGPASQGFRLPGSFSKRRIKELQAQIHHLDKAHHYAQLGDIYLDQGKYQEAEKCFRSALEREPEDLDYQAHLGHCLVRQGNASGARPLLENVCRQKPDHDFGYSMMALAETLQSLGDTKAALAVWHGVLERHNYARARVQRAELLLKKNDAGTARKELEEVLVENAHGPAFQAKADRVWIKKARALLKKMPK